MRQLSVTRAKAREGAEPEVGGGAMLPASMSEAELHSGWQTLQADLANKTETLERILQRRKSGVGFYIVILTKYCSNQSRVVCLSVSVFWCV